MSDGWCTIESDPGGQPSTSHAAHAGAEYIPGLAPAAAKYDSLHYQAGEDEQSGEISVEAVAELVHCGAITAATLVWTEVTPPPPPTPPLPTHTHKKKKRRKNVQPTKVCATVLTRESPTAPCTQGMEQWETLGACCALFTGLEEALRSSAGEAKVVVDTTVRTYNADPADPRRTPCTRVGCWLHTGGLLALQSHHSCGFRRCATTRAMGISATRSAWRR